MSDVSRETPAPAPPAPTEAQGVFPVGRLDLAIAYAERLAHDGVIRGLIGPRETPRLWSRHLLNSAVVAEQVPADARVADIGSGAGLPGIPLAIARPDVTVLLVEPLLRRSSFLEEVVRDLGLEASVSVVRARAEDLHGSETVRPGFDVVTSRAVAPLGRLMDWCMPLVAPTGVMLALKGSTAADEVEAASGELTAWRTAEPEIGELGAAVVDDPTQFVRIAWEDPASVSWPPRRVRPRPPGRKGRRARRG